MVRLLRTHHPLINLTMKASSRIYSSPNISTVFIYDVCLCLSLTTVKVELEEIDEGIDYGEL